jgi:spore maturation protein CgeB
MNVLYFGSTDGTSSALNYYHSLLKLGGTVLPFDPRYFDTSSPIERLKMRLRKAPTEARRARVAEQLKALCRATRFDLVFVMSENFLSGETIHAIRSEIPDAPKFLYHSHDNNYAPGILKPADFLSDTLPQYDFVFTTKSQNVARYRSDGVTAAHYLPSAYEPAVHRPLTEGESRLGDKSFVVGTYDRSRDAYVEAIGWENLHVWGSDWRRYPRFSANRERITPRPIYYLEFADVITHCRVALGLLREEAQDLHTQRTFEIPACGALQIAPRNDEILGFFEEDKEIVCFESPAELEEKVRYYLDHERAARKIAEAGHRRCLTGRHTYEDRVTEMVRIVTGTKSTARRARSR